MWECHFKAKFCKLYCIKRKQRLNHNDNENYIWQLHENNFYSLNLLLILFYNIYINEEHTNLRRSYDLLLQNRLNNLTESVVLFDISYSYSNI